MNNLHVKFDNDWVKTLACIVPKMFLDSAKFEIDLWPRDPKSIGLLLLSWTTYMWSLQVIRKKLQFVSCPQGKACRTHGQTERRTDARTHPFIQPYANGRITISPPTLLRGKNKASEKHTTKTKPLNQVTLWVPRGLYWTKIAHAQLDDGANIEDHKLDLYCIYWQRRCGNKILFTNGRQKDGYRKILTGVWPVELKIRCLLNINAPRQQSQKLVLTLAHWPVKL